MGTSFSNLWKQPEVKVLIQGLDAAGEFSHFFTLLLLLFFFLVASRLVHDTIYRRFYLPRIPSSESAFSAEFIVG